MYSRTHCYARMRGFGSTEKTDGGPGGRQGPPGSAVCFTWNAFRVGVARLLALALLNWDVDNVS